LQRLEDARDGDRRRDLAGARAGEVFMLDEMTRSDAMVEVGAGAGELVLPADLGTPYLLIVAPDGTWRSELFPASGVLTIGRGGEVGVRLYDPVVSRRHARLETTAAGGFRIVDLGSANGTRVGGRVVRNDAVAVRPGQPILIGRTVLAVHAPSPPAVGSAAPPLRQGSAMVDVDALVEKSAPTLYNVLLLGETGVGKGVVARRIHERSTRAGGRFEQLTCAGLSATLLESELFGHRKGAFTGADKDKPGLLEEAAGGTVFLDEVGEMPLEVQAKLLVAIEQRVTRRVGSNRTTPIDVRFICATHRDLGAEIRRNRFRADFYHRISQVPIHIPPLRDRRDELDALVLQLSGDAAAHLKRERAPAFDDDARAGLHRHDWPGNIRELRNLVERAVLLTDGNVVCSRILVAAGLPDDLLPAAGSPEDLERRSLIDALVEHSGNQSRAARQLGISRNTLRARMQKYGLKGPRSKHDPSKGSPS
jgi:two-component system response regulator AtoC